MSMTGLDMANQDNDVNAPGLTAISERQAGFIEGYAEALDRVLYSMTGEGFSAKSYDPATVDLRKATIYSYAFNLKNGSRQHPLADFECMEEILSLMATEALDYLRDEMGVKK